MGVGADLVEEKRATRPKILKVKTARVRSETPASWRISLMRLPRVMPLRPIAEKIIQMVKILKTPRMFRKKVV